MKNIFLVMELCSDVISFFMSNILISVTTVTNRLYAGSERFDEPN
jgi:hypothetical protein